MSPRLTDKIILNLLTGMPNEELLCIGRQDVIAVLKNSSGLERCQHKALVSHLDDMAKRGKIHLERTNGRITRIALPEAAAIPTDEEDSMVTGRNSGTGQGRRRVTEPTYADGSQLPSLLPDNRVGPVESRQSFGAKTEEDIQAAAELICEELPRLNKSQFTEEELNRLIDRVVGTIDSSAVAVVRNSVKDHVIELCLRRVNKGGPATVVYELKRRQAPQESPETYEQAVTGLLAALNKSKQEGAELRRLLSSKDDAIAELQASTIPPEELTALLDKLQEAHSTNERLAAQQRTAEQQHQQELARVQETSSATIAQLQAEVKAAKSALAEAEKQLAAMSTRSTLSPELQKRVRDALGR